MPLFSISGARVDGTSREQNRAQGNGRHERSRTGRAIPSLTEIPPRSTIYIYARSTTVVLYLIVVILLGIAVAKKASGDLLIFTLFAPVFAICFALCDLFMFTQSGLGTFLCDLIIWPIILLPTLIFLASRQQGTVSEKLYKTPKDSPWTSIDYLVAIAAIMAVVTSGIQIGCMFYVLLRIPRINLARSESGQSRNWRNSLGRSRNREHERRQRDLEAGRTRTRRPERVAGRSRRQREHRQPAIEIAGLRLYGNPAEEVVNTPLPRYC